MRPFLLGEEPAEVGVLALGEELIMVVLRGWGLRGCEIALLWCEKAGLASYVDLGGRSSRRTRSRSTARRGRGREGKVDGIGEESVLVFPLVIVLHSYDNRGGCVCATLGTAKSWSYHEL
jgi:hypothetical protein